MNKYMIICGLRDWKILGIKKIYDVIVLGDLWKCIKKYI